MNYHRKKTWKDCRDLKILTIFNEVKEETMRLYPEYFNTNIEFYIDSSTKNLGKCTGEFDKTTIQNKYGYKNHFQNIRWKNVAIILSKYVTDLTAIRNTIVHEFGHLVAPKEKHSCCWETRANKIGAKWGIKCTRLANAKDSKSFKAAIIEDSVQKGHSVVCTGCGYIAHRTRMCDIIRHPQNWKCGICGSKFKNI